MNTQDFPLKNTKSFSIPVCFLLLISNFPFGMAVYIFLKIIPGFPSSGADKNYFLLLDEFFTNLLMIPFLLWLCRVKLNETFDVSNLKKEILIAFKPLLLFIALYFSFIPLFYYFKIPSFGFDVFKASLFPPSGQEVLNKNNLILFVNICVLAPLKEEILIRRFLYVSLRKKMSFFISSLLSSAFFGLLHGDFTTAFLYSLMASYVYEKYGNLKINIIMHAIVNFLIISIFFAFS